MRALLGRFHRQEARRGARYAASVNLRMTGASYWRRRLAAWPPASAGTSPGYTLLVPVPGDLPVFLELALSVCAMQEATHRVSTLVIPDRLTPAIRETVARRRSSWAGPLELVPLPRPERWFLPHLRSGSRNHGLQLITGVGASRSSHIILHDADLFILDRRMHDDQYERCRDHDLDCLGISPVWDQWYAGHDRRLAATWDMTASVDWLRSFLPYQQIGHDGDLFGERHTFDTTLYPQAVSPSDRIDFTDRDADYVHFNYVISAFRDFQRSQGGYRDADFRLLLIALFVELFAEPDMQAMLPSLRHLGGGLGSTDQPVHFPSADDGRADYQMFRLKLERALQGPYLSTGDSERGRLALEPFDRYYGCEQ